MTKTLLVWEGLVGWLVESVPHAELSPPPSSDRLLSKARTIHLSSHLRGGGGRKAWKPPSLPLLFTRSHQYQRKGEREAGAGSETKTHAQRGLSLFRLCLVFSRSHTYREKTWGRGT